jgi:hypothetical protein
MQLGLATASVFSIVPLDPMCLVKSASCDVRETPLRRRFERTVPELVLLNVQWRKRDEGRMASTRLKDSRKERAVVKTANARLGDNLKALDFREGS